MSGYNWMGYAERALNADVVDYVDGDGNLMQGAAMVPGFARDAPSLFARVLIPDPEVIPEWVQPDSTNPYMAGDRVTHNGKTWESQVDNNVWEPGVYGWTEI